MLFMNVCAAVEIGNRAGHFEDAGVGPGGETKPVGDQFQHAGCRLHQAHNTREYDAASSVRCSGP